MAAHPVPIFVHASPRSGSTYFFNVLRRDKSLMCFNEPMSDVFEYWGKRGTGRFWEHVKWDANHRFLDRDDFSEILEAWDLVMHLLPPALPFQDYLPPGGVLPSSLRTYLLGLLQYAQSRGKRAALCDIHSRGRAGAMRDAFAGFHISQYRDPLSQFGSFYRPLPQSGELYFLVFPLMELGTCGDHPLYAAIPEKWRVPAKPYPVDDAGRRWASTVEYLAMVASPAGDTIEKLFRWHLFSWLLGNLAAICYSDLFLDIDKMHDDLNYRRSVVGDLLANTGVAADFSDVAKFPRYYEFEGLDVTAVAGQVTSTIEEASRDGRIEAGVRALAKRPPVTAVAHAVELLLSKVHASISAMAASTDRIPVSATDWVALVENKQIIWFNPRLRKVMQHLYPFGAPIVRAARRAGNWRKSTLS